MGSKGEIKWHGRSIFISEVLIGEPVGLEEQDNDWWAVRFGPIDLGAIEQKGRMHKPRLWI